MAAVKKVPRESCELPLTPMIDVVFLLNIFFVCVQFRALAGQLEARLPKTPGIVNRIRSEEELLDNNIWVRVETPPAWKERSAADETTGSLNEAGLAQPVLISVNGQPVSDFDALQYELASRKFRLEADGLKALVILELAPGLMFQNVVSTVNAAKKARFSAISFTPPGGLRRD
jgi:biopolymer transport protein ExbD